MPKTNSLLVNNSAPIARSTRGDGHWAASTGKNRKARFSQVFRILKRESLGFVRREFRTGRSLASVENLGAAGAAARRRPTAQGGIGREVRESIQGADLVMAKVARPSFGIDRGARSKPEPPTTYGDCGKSPTLFVNRRNGRKRPCPFRGHEISPQNSLRAELTTPRELTTVSNSG